MSVVVLYEDKLIRDARSPSLYPPHQFVMHCVADELHQDPWVLLSEVRGVPLKGVGNIKNAMDDPSRFRPNGQNLVFVADADVIHKHFRVASQAPESLRQGILAGLPDRTGIDLFLLVENLEDLVAAAARLLGRPVPSKGHCERDGILGALLEASKIGARKQLVGQVAMLREIVDHIRSQLIIPKAHS